MELLATLQANPVFFVIVVALFSALIGSFLNVVIYRLPIMMEREWREECHEFLNLHPEKPIATEKSFNLVTPRSRCPSCKHLIRSWENIPVVSWLFLRGKCAHCKTKISVRYPLLELTTALISAYVAWHFGFSWETLFALFFTWSLLCLIFIDIDQKLLPDSITLSLLWLGIMVNLNGTFVSSFDSIIGAIAGYASLRLFADTFKLITGKDGMGRGDFKLFAALGAWMGWQLLPFIILTSSLVGSIIGITMMKLTDANRQTPIPFGPYLAIAGWIAFLWGKQIVDLYLKFAGF